MIELKFEQNAIKNKTAQAKLCVAQNVPNYVQSLSKASSLRRKVFDYQFFATQSEAFFS